MEANCRLQLESLDKRLTRVEERLDQLYDKIISLVGRNAITQSTSPLTLTDFGKKLSQKVNAEKLAERYADKLFNEIEGMNEYQIQEFCFKFAKEDLLEMKESERRD